MLECPFASGIRPEVLTRKIFQRFFQNYTLTGNMPQITHRYVQVH
jgi:hypothetical protein